MRLRFHPVSSSLPTQPPYTYTRPTASRPVAGSAGTAYMHLLLNVRSAAQHRSIPRLARAFLYTCAARALRTCGSAT